MRRFSPATSLFVLLSVLLAPVSSNARSPAVMSKPASPTTAAPITHQRHAVQALSSGPLMFVENVGQFDDRARFLMRGALGGDVWLTDDGIWVTLLEPATDEAEAMARQGHWPEAYEPGQRASTHIKLSFSGASANPRITPFNRLATRVSYFIGNDPEAWYRDVPTWGGVRYEGIYPGLDLEIVGGDTWSWRLASRSGEADLGSVRLQVDGAEGVAWPDGEAGGLSIRVGTALGQVALPLLGIDGAAAPLEAPSAKISDAEIIAPFGIQQAPPSNLSTDSADAPQDLAYATFLGGSDDDWASDIAVDDSGHAYAVGMSYSPLFPAKAGPGYSSDLQGYVDAFVAKLNAAGDGLVYATFLGGDDGCVNGSCSWPDYAEGIAVDDSGNAYVTGWTASADFPMGNGRGYDTELNANDAFVVKLSASGTELLYATFLGGSASDRGHDIALDDSGSAYVTGETWSSDFPGAGSPGYDASYHGGEWGDAFVAKLNPEATSLVYATYLGGTGSEAGNGIALDSSANAYVTGFTTSTDFPAADGPGYDTQLDGLMDAFAIKLNSSGTDLEYATFLGGSEIDDAAAVAVDGDQNAYIVGDTESTDLWTGDVPGYDASHNGGYDDAVVLKLDATGTALTYATYLGGSGMDYATNVALDAQGGAYVCGVTDSADLITGEQPGYDKGFNGGSSDGFLIRLDPPGTSVTHATYLGGRDQDSIAGLALDAGGNAYVTGLTLSDDFPAAGASGYDNSYNGGFDAYAAKLRMHVIPADVAVLSGFYLEDADQSNGFPPSITDVRVQVSNLGDQGVKGEVILYAGDREVERTSFPDSGKLLAPQAVADVWFHWDLGSASGRMEDVELKAVADIDSLEDSNPADNVYSERVSVYWADFLLKEGDAYRFKNQGYTTTDFWQDLGDLDRYWGPAGLATVAASSLGRVADWYGCCLGMSTTSIIYRDHEALRPGGYPTTWNIPEDDAWPMIRKYQRNMLLQVPRVIQTLDPDYDASREFDRVVGLLTRDRPKPAELSLTRKSGEGNHSVVAYKAIEATSQTGTRRILLIYDNNLPFEELVYRALMADIDVSGQFEYEPLPNKIYDRFYAHDIEPMLDDVVAEAALKEAQEEQLSENTISVFVGSPVEALIADKEGNRLGVLDGQEVREIANGEMWQLGDQIVLAVPADGAYSFQARGLATAPPGSTMTLAYTVPSGENSLLEVTFKDVEVEPNQTSTTEVSVDIEDVEPIHLPDGSTHPPDTVNLVTVAEAVPSQAHLPLVCRESSTLACEELIRNGGFEADGGWEIPITAYQAGYSGAEARSGSRSMRVGIVDPDHNKYAYSSARQLVTIPTDASSATLGFWLYPTSGDPATLARPARPLATSPERAGLTEDAQYVLVLDEHDDWIGTLLWQRRDDRDWTYHEVDMLDYAGQTIKLHFGAFNDGAGGATGMFVDDVSLDVCLP